MSRPTIKLGDLISRRRIIPILENSAEGGLIAFEKDDFIPEVLTEARFYTSVLTAQTHNQFPISSIESRIKLEDSQGIPSGITNPGDNNQSHYTQNFQGNGGGEAEFNKSSNSGQLDVDQSHGGEFRVKKGQNPTPGIPTGTDIFTDLNSKGEQADFAKRVRRVLGDNNKNVLGNPHLPRVGLEDPDIRTISIPGFGGSGGTSLTEDESNLGASYVQQEFGKHTPRKFPTAEGQNSLLLKLQDLKKIGLLTMLQASGEYYIPTDPNDAAQELAARGASLAPGLARIGQKIDIARVSPTKIMKDVNPQFFKPTLDDNIKKNPVLSYGNVNSWMTPFAGLNSTASIACAALLSLTIGGLLKGAALLLNTRTVGNPEDSEINTSLSGRRKRIGSFLGKASETATYRNTELELAVLRTSNDYFQCVSKGIDIFFGVNDLGAEAQKLVENHGYYNVVLRSLIRSTTDFVKLAVGGAVNPNLDNVTGVNDVAILGNPMGSLELLQKINSSQILKFCNILATLGDISLNHEAAGYLINPDGSVDEWISDIDKIVVAGNNGPGGTPGLNISVLQSVNRLPDSHRGALAWGCNTVQSMYMFPESLLRAEGRFIGSTNQAQSAIESVMAGLDANNNIKGPDQLNHKNRISKEDVQVMEEYLNADYMPFYFHDLRTNEIIAFHAFLEEVTDGFDAEYTETEGYGRVGSVMTYKNTKRSISLGFRVVATNPQDFDEMYFKINKLVTMVYPQYTEGRLVGTNNNRFIQPFSQVPSASPMIRLRLGDLFKSNYSKFGVARLFGIGSGQFNLEGANGEYQYQARFVAAREEVSRRMNSGIFHVGEQAFLLPRFVNNPRGSGQRALGYPRVGDLTDTPSQAGQTARNGRAGRRGAGNAAQQGFLTTRTGQQHPFASNGRPLVSSQTLRILITRETTNPDGIRIYEFSIQNGTDGQDGIFRTSQFSLRSIPDEIRRVSFNQSQTQGSSTTNPTSTNTPSIINAFFSSEGEQANPVIQSFESSAGKGLAGFIKSLKLDMNEARWETERLNARSPMSFKVNIDFHPIADLPMGLDSNGFNTAPAYNTGDVMKSLNEQPEQRNQNNSDETRQTRNNSASTPRAGSGAPTRGSPLNGITRI